MLPVMMIDAVFFDFRKAFDVVENDVLLCKLTNIGFTPHLLQIFASYMSDRQQYVEYSGHRSEPYFVRSGLSHSSNLGLLKFVIIINVLLEVIKESQFLIFADNLKLFLPVSSAADCDLLQNDINNVMSWSEQKRL